MQLKVMQLKCRFSAHLKYFLFYSSFPFLGGAIHVQVLGAKKNGQTGLTRICPFLQYFMQFFLFAKTGITDDL